MVIQSNFYELVGIFEGDLTEIAQDEWISVLTPDGRRDEYLRKFWEIDPT